MSQYYLELVSHGRVRVRVTRTVTLSGKPSCTAHFFSLGIQQVTITSRVVDGFVYFGSLYVVCFRERLVAEREGAARAWETSLRSEQAAARQALSDAGARGREVEAREASLREEKQVHKFLVAFHLHHGSAFMRGVFAFYLLMVFLFICQGESLISRTL